MGKDSYYNSLNSEQESRWMALLLAVDLVDNKCKENNIQFDTIELYHPPIEHFVKEKSKQIEKNLVEEKNKKLNQEIICKVFFKQGTRIGQKV